MSYNLFLDDFRTPEMAAQYFTAAADTLRKEDWVIVKTYSEFVNHITLNGLPDKVSFDHDLADIHYSIPTSHKAWEKYHENKKREYTGYDCAKWLLNYIIDNGLMLPEIIIHTKNTVGAENIYKLFENYKNFLKKYS